MGIQDRKWRMTDQEYKAYVREEMKVPKKAEGGEDFQNLLSPGKMKINKEVKRLKAERQHWEDKIKDAIGYNNVMEKELADKRGMGLKAPKNGKSERAAPPKPPTKPKPAHSIPVETADDVKNYFRKLLMEHHRDLSADWDLLRETNRKLAQVVEHQRNAFVEIGESTAEKNNQMGGMGFEERKVIPKEGLPDAPQVFQMHHKRQPTKAKKPKDRTKEKQKLESEISDMKRTIAQLKNNLAK